MPQNPDPRTTAIRYLSRRACHSKELEAYLKRKGFSSEIQPLIEDFLRLGYLNDEEWLVHFKRAEERKGRSSLASNAKLRQKGIKASVSPSKDALQNAIQKKTKGKTLTQDEKRKAVASLIRRGFHYDEVLQALRLEEI